METLMDVVPSIKIAAEHTLEVLPNQLLDDFSAPRMVVFIITNGGSRGAPDVAVDPIFSPPRFIRLDRRASADLHVETTEEGLRILSHPVQQFHEFAQAHLEAVQISQDLSKLAQR